MKRWHSLIAPMWLVTVLSTTATLHAQATGSGANTPEAQQLQRRPIEKPELQSRSDDAAGQKNELVLDVVAIDKANHPLAGLHAENFEILDNKKPVGIGRFQAITSNHNEANGGAQVSLVIDAINTSRESLARTEDEVKRFLKEDGGHLALPISILILSDSKPVTRKDGASSIASTTTALPDRQAFFRRIPPSADGNALAQALDQNVIGLSRISEAQGGLGETEKARLSIEALDAIGTAEEKVQGHKVIIWISPGWARLARANTKSKTSLFSDIIYFSDLMRDARITLDFINPDGVSGTIRADPPQAQTESQIAFKSPASFEPTAESGPSWYEAYYGAVKNPNQADVNDLALQVLAHQSGGLVLSKDNRIAPQIARCVGEAAVSYAIFYLPSHRSSSPEYHEVEVKIREGNGTARTREGYYAK